VGSCLVDIAGAIDGVVTDATLPVIAQITMQGNATGTTISVAGTYVKVAGTTVSNITPQKATVSNGRITLATGNTGETRYLSVTGSVSVYCDTGSHVIKLAIAKNGTVIANTAAMNTTNNSASKQVQVSAQLAILATEGDYFELFVTENEHAESLTCTNLNLMVHQIGSFAG
jgi:hypothetical protein